MLFGINAMSLGKKWRAVKRLITTMKRERLLLFWQRCRDDYGYNEEASLSTTTNPNVVNCMNLLGTSRTSKFQGACRKNPFVRPSSLLLGRTWFSYIFEKKTLACCEKRWGLAWVLKQVHAARRPKQRNRKRDRSKIQQTSSPRISSPFCQDLCCILQ